MMLKEHIVDAYGLIRYTIGNGCSGGGLQQYIVAAMYPGLLDGIQPNCSFTDVWTTLPDVVDCHLIDHYLLSMPPAGATPMTQAQQQFVDGHFDPSDCNTWDATFASAIDPTNAANCALPTSAVYNPQTNPKGVRCTIQDYQASIWGLRPPRVWGPVETKLGAGFANAPLDNVGVEYGFNAVNSQQITVDQFLDLNHRIGSVDIDDNYVPGRRTIDPGAATIAYRAGQVTDARQLAAIPIIDLAAGARAGKFTRASTPISCARAWICWRAVILTRSSGPSKPSFRCWASSPRR